MEQKISSYRPHDPGHNYYAPGIYLITLVVTERQHILSTLNMDIHNPGVTLSPAGLIVASEWDKTSSIQSAKGRKIITHNQVCMPDHWHGVIEVCEYMDISLGAIINAFKSSCTSRWRKEVTHFVQSPCTAQMIRHMAKERRAAYYATRPLIERPLFDDNYDDTICLSDPITGAYDQRHLSAMLRYVDDNPRRAIIRRLRPEFMQRCMHVRIDGHDYAAFGNLFLLRWAKKVQVFCHRKASDGRTPYEQTEAFRDQCREWKRKVMSGSTVIVTPGISAGERIIKDRCLESGYPLIHILKETIGAYWKPEAKRFEACTNGSLLILSPWNPTTMGSVGGVPSDTDYSIFHNLNTLAEQICLFNGEAVMMRK